MEITKEQFYDYIHRENDPETLEEAIKVVEQEGGVVIHRSTQYYLNYYDQLASGSEKTKWNWSAFIFQYLWSVYRKMYIPSIVYLALCNMLGFLEVFFAEKEIFLYVLLLYVILVVCLSVFWGFRGNYFYYRDVVQRVRKGARRKGKSPLMVFIFMVLGTLLNVLSDKL